MRQNRNMNTPFQKHKRELWEKIRAAYNKGCTISHIEAWYCVSNTTVNRALKGMRNRRVK